MKSAGAQTSKKLWTPPTFSWHLPVISKEINKNPAYHWASVCFLIPNRPFFPRRHGPVHPGEPCTHPGAWNCPCWEQQARQPAGVYRCTQSASSISHTHTHTYMKRCVSSACSGWWNCRSDVAAPTDMVERSCESITRTWCVCVGGGSGIGIHFVLTNK